MKTLTSLVLTVFLIVSMISCKKADESGTATELPGVVTPTLTTADISSITSVSAISGGVISSNGGSDIIASGVCFSTHHNPTLTDRVDTSISNNTIFTARITGLSLDSFYYVRSFATNSGGATGYGNEVSFITAVAVGQFYQGGMVFYLDNKGEHGLVVDTIAFPSTSWGCKGSLLGADSASIGTGALNTSIIITNCSTSGIAARVASSSAYNGYNDWFLPSVDELIALYNQRRAVNIRGAGIYWSSTEVDDNNAYWVDFSTGSQTSVAKDSQAKVYAVRAF